MSKFKVGDRVRVKTNYGKIRTIFTDEEKEKEAIVTSTTPWEYARVVGQKYHVKIDDLKQIIHEDDIEPATPQPDYNDGKWHGWNGGECPVHGESVIRVCTASEGIRPDQHAKLCYWGFSSDIIAFRVVTPYKEPRTITIDGVTYKEVME